MAQKNPSVTIDVFMRANSEIALRFDRLERRIDDMEARMATKDDVHRILSFIDAFTHRLETYDRKAVIHEAVLKLHEDRLARLEGRPS